MKPRIQIEQSGAGRVSLEEAAEQTESGAKRGEVGGGRWEVYRRQNFFQAHSLRMLFYFHFHFHFHFQFSGGRHGWRCGGPSYRHPLCRRAYACQFARRNKIGPVKRVAREQSSEGLHTRCGRSCQEWSRRSDYLAWRVLATNSSPRRSFCGTPQPIKFQRAPQ